jgi:hypothetical protein
MEGFFMNRNPLIIAIPCLLVVAVLLSHPKAKPVIPELPTIIPGTLDWKYLPQAKGWADLAPEYREHNYGGGSCGHASTESAFRWPGSIDPIMMQQAALWRSKYGGGENDRGHEIKLKASGLKYVMTRDGDTELLEWLVTTRRMAWIAYKPSHMINLCGRIESNGKRYAILLDNNHTEEFEYVEWDTFVQRWKGFGGWAGTAVYDPPPPIPTA